MSAPVAGGMNVWQSAGAGRRDERATGLAWFSLEVEKPDMFAAQEERLRQSGAQVATLANGSKRSTHGARGCG
jgi:catechol 2,3-dioxygenase